MLALLSVLLFAAPSDSPWNDFRHANSKVVESVLESREKTFDFLVAPDSPYAERRAVGQRAGTVLDISSLRRIDALRAEFEHFYWSYAPENSPYSSMGKLGDSSDAGQSIILAGHAYVIPAKRVPYPETFEERRKAPWPWQVRLALDDAWRSVMNSATRETFVSFAASLACENAEDAAFFRKATTELAYRFRVPMPVSIVGAWRNLLLRTNSSGGNALSPFINTWALRYANRDAWLYAHVILLDRIQAGDVYGAAVHLQNLRERVNEEPGRDLRGAIPYSAILAISRWTMNDPNPANDYARVMAALSVGRVLGESILRDDDKLRPSVDQDQPKIIHLFTDWFVEREQVIEKLAATETADLDRARNELAAVEQCRSGARLSF